MLFGAMEGGVAVVCERVYLCIRENVCMCVRDSVYVYVWMRSNIVLERYLL